jgi:hypothetical protein
MVAKFSLIVNTLLVRDENISPERVIGEIGWVGMYLLTLNYRHDYLRLCLSLKLSCGFCGSQLEPMPLTQLAYTSFLVVVVTVSAIFQTGVL